MLTEEQKLAAIAESGIDKPEDVAVFAEGILFAHEKVTLNGKEYWPALYVKTDGETDLDPENPPEAHALLFTESQIRRAKDAAENLPQEEKDKIVFITGMVDDSDIEDLIPASEAEESILVKRALENLTSLQFLKLFFISLFR